MGRWLHDGLLGGVAAVLGVGLDGPLQMVEVRHVQNELPGALDRAPGGFMLHAVGAPPPDGGVDAVDAVDAALRRAVEAAAAGGTGLAVSSWCDGRAAVPDALPAEVRDRVAASRTPWTPAACSAVPR